MIQQKNNIYWHKFNAFTRYFLAYGFSGIMPYYIVNEYPKSGGSWLSQMLASALEIPFPRNRLPMLCPCILHEHFFKVGTLKNVIVIWRDGRDVIVSQYYHSLFPNDRGWGNKILVDRVSAALQFNDIQDIKKNLPFFIEYVFKEKKHPESSWTDFVDRWQGNKDAVHVKYEDLCQNCASELQRVTFELSGRKLSDARAATIVENFSFKKQSGREPGNEDTGSFMRKGIVGDWKNHFSPKSKQLFDQYAGNALISLGYETDHLWSNS